MHFLSILSTFLQISAFYLTIVTWILPLKPQWKLFITQGIILKRIFPKIFHYFGPMTLSLLPKKHFLSILGKFLQITTFYSTKTWKLSHKTMVEIVHNTQGIILKQNFFHNFSLFWPYDVIFGHIHTLPYYKCLMAEKSWGEPNFILLLKVRLCHKDVGKYQF